MICLLLVNISATVIDGAVRSAPMKPDELGFEKILLIKRPTFASDHFYTDFINGCDRNQFRKDNGIYIYTCIHHIKLAKRFEDSL